MRTIFQPFPRLTTSRLILRQATEDDWEEILFLRSDQEVNKHISRPAASSLMDAVEFIRKVNGKAERGESIYWSITHNNQDKMIGSICLWNFNEDLTTGEIGYDLHPEYQRQGIMSEALGKVIEFGFETLQLHQIMAYTHFENEGSIRLLEKSNFILIKNLTDPDNADNIIFCLRKEK